MNATLVLIEMSPNLEHEVNTLNIKKFYSMSAGQAIKPPDLTVCSPNITSIVTLHVCSLGWQVNGRFGII